MLRKLSVVLALLAFAALPQAAMAKRHSRTAHHKVAHAKKHGSATRAASLSDPGTSITDPGTSLTDPGTSLTDPGTSITDPGTTIGNPAQACRAEESDDSFEETHGEDFAHFYGTNPNLRNAFGMCVSQHAREGGDGADEADGSDD